MLEIEDDFFLPEQAPSPSRLTALQKLCWSLLEDAFTVRRHVLSGRAGTDLKRQMQRDEEWLSGEPAPITFEDLCDLLNIEPSAVRHRYDALVGRAPRRNGFHKLSTGV